MMPPAASTGTLRIGLIALMTSGTSTMVETSPQWPPASVPWATRISTPAATWRSACSLEPTSAATGTSCLRPMSIIAFGGTPSAFAISLIGWRNETSSTSSARCASNGCGWLSATLVVVSSMPYFFRRLRVKSRCCGEIRASRLFQVTSFSPAVEMFSGISTSSPYGLPSVCSSIHFSSCSIVSGECAVAPSTPKPPARLTAATTSRQWLKASSGNSIPSMSQIGDFMADAPCGGRSPAAHCWFWMLTER